LLKHTQTIAVAKIHKTEPNKLASRSKLPFVDHNTHVEGYRTVQRASTRKMMDLKEELK
jgi:hypothetical protein